MAAPSEEPTRSVAASGRLVGGRYRLIDKLGSGGFGRVWRALDTSLDVEVAIKEVVLPPDLTGAERADRLTRASREARNAARLRSNPHVVSVHDVVAEDGTPWIVMELVPGRSLAERLREDGALSVEQATQVARAVLSALGASHAAGIVHRDVKPANVMLTDDGRVLLTDFGIAVLTSDTRLTTAGHFIGSVEYLAPERAKGEESRPAADLFSLGATLYHAVEGVSAFSRDTVAATLGAVLFEDVPAPTRAGTLTPLLGALLMKDPNTRPDVAQSLRILDTAESAAAGSDASVTVSATSPWSATSTSAAALPAAAGRRQRTAPIWKASRAIPFALLAAMPFVPILHVDTDEGTITYSTGLHVGFMESWHSDSGWPVGVGIAVYVSLLLPLTLWVIPGVRRVWKALGYLLVLAALAETVVYAVNIAGDFHDRRYELANALGTTGNDRSISPFVWYAPALALLTLALYVWRDSPRWRRLFRRTFISAPNSAPDSPAAAAPH